MKAIEKKRILMLGPHTDDVELGCGGLICRSLEEGSEVFVAVFSTAVESLPKGQPADLLKREFFEAARALKLKKDNLFVYDYPVRKLSYFRQNVLEEMVSLKKRLQPDLVLLPSGSDLHQDHQVVFAEGLRAFKELSVWGYELPWNHINFSAQAFVVLQQRHVNAKWKALKKYRSQIRLKRPYFEKDFILGLARVRGIQVKENWAESFEVLRWKVA